MLTKIDVKLKLEQHLYYYVERVKCYIVGQTSNNPDHEHETRIKDFLFEA